MRVIIFLFILFVSISCNSRAVKTATKQYDDNSLEIPVKYRFGIVIPEGGCGGCIDGGISFVKDNMKYIIDNDDIFVVFTAISSEKLIRRSLELKGDATNIIFDYDNDYFIKGENQIYPMLLTLDNGKIIDIEYMSPQNSGVLNKVSAWIER